VRVTLPPEIDGVLDDDAWTGAGLSLSDWLTYNPMNGDHIPQTTRCARLRRPQHLLRLPLRRPRAAKVRSTLSRRDNMWNDDWVGLSLDSVGNGQSSYDLFVNPQASRTTSSRRRAPARTRRPDFVWMSAGRRTATGYDVEMRLPLTSFRFKAGARCGWACCSGAA
jgi:hypothetical protein